MRNEQSDLLNGLSQEETDHALALGTRIHLASGATLFNLGDDADRVFVIERGRIRLTLPMQVRGQEQDVFVDEMCLGQTVGWSALIPPHRFTLKATAPLETEVIALSREVLREVFDTYPHIGYTVSLNLATVIGQRLQMFQAMWLREMQRNVEVHCH
jgi:CRP-like cAMP-binding protein